MARDGPHAGAERRTHGQDTSLPPTIRQPAVGQASWEATREHGYSGGGCMTADRFPGDCRVARLPAGRRTLGPPDRCGPRPRHRHRCDPAPADPAVDRPCHGRGHGLPHGLGRLHRQAGRHVPGRPLRRGRPHPHLGAEHLRLQHGDRGRAMPSRAWPWTRLSGRPGPPWSAPSSPRSPCFRSSRSRSAARATVRGSSPGAPLRPVCGTTPPLRHPRCRRSAMPDGADLQGQHHPACASAGAAPQPAASAAVAQVREARRAEFDVVEGDLAALAHG